MTPGGTIFDPSGIICTNLVEVHLVMLNTKYQGSWPRGFRQEDRQQMDKLELVCPSAFSKLGHKEKLAQNSQKEGLSEAMFIFITTVSYIY